MYVVELRDNNVNVGENRSPNKSVRKSPSRKFRRHGETYYDYDLENVIDVNNEKKSYATKL